MPHLTLKLKHLLVLMTTTVFLSLIATAGYSQTTASSESATETAVETAALELDEDERLSTEEIEQLVAPIALHPDSLLSQILMAATYPLEVVTADRWVKANPKVTDAALETAMVDKDWDPSIKALTAFPTVLDMLNTDLSWTQQLGDAFLAQQEDVLAAVQTLRKQAQDSGNLKSNEQITYKEETAKTNSGETKTVIVAQPTKTEIVYVPTYNPTVVYGSWAYPAYPPYTYYPPGYNAARGLFWFSVGYAVGNNWWGGCNWGRNNVKVNINVYNRNRYTVNKINSSNWKHNSYHRKAVPYRNNKVAKRHSNVRKRDNKARENYRGRANKGRRDLSTQNRTQRPNKSLSKQKRQSAAKKVPNRKATRPANTRQSVKKNPAYKRPTPKKTKRPQQTTKTPKRSAYKGNGRGKSVKQHSNRGGQSRARNQSRKSPKRRGGGGRRSR